MEENTKQKMVDEAILRYKSRIEECKNQLCCRDLPELKEAFERFCEGTLPTFTEFIQNRWKKTHQDPAEYVTCLIEYDRDSKLYRLDYLFSLLPSKGCNKEIYADLDNTWANIITWLGGKKSKVQQTTEILYGFFLSIEQMLQCVDLYRGYSRSRKYTSKEFYAFFDSMKPAEERYKIFENAVDEARPFPPIKPDILRPGMEILQLVWEVIRKMKEAYDNPLLEIGYYNKDDHKGYYSEITTQLFNKISQNKRNPDTIVWDHITGYFQFMFKVTLSQATKWGASLYNGHFFGNLGKRHFKDEWCYRSVPITSHLFREMTKLQKNKIVYWETLNEIDFFYHIGK